MLPFSPRGLERPRWRNCNEQACCWDHVRPCFWGVLMPWVRWPFTALRRRRMPAPTSRRAVAAPSEGCPEYSPKAVPMTFAVREGFDSNVFQTSANPISSFYTNWAAGLSTSLGGPRLQVQTSLGAGLTYYYTRPGEKLDFTGLLDLRVAYLGNAQTYPRARHLDGLPLAARPDHHRAGTASRSGDYSTPRPRSWPTTSGRRGSRRSRVTTFRPSSTRRRRLMTNWVTSPRRSRSRFAGSGNRRPLWSANIGSIR